MVRSAARLVDLDHAHIPGVRQRQRAPRATPSSLPVSVGAAPPGRWALFAVGMEADLYGVSTRKIDDLVRALVPIRGISKSEVSRIRAELDAEVGALRDRSLAAQPFPYVCSRTPPTAR